jgi:hypothetical protein
LIVSIDGKRVLLNETRWAIGKGADTMWAIGENADTVWRNLKQVELRPFQFYKVEADTGDPLRATLKGKVIIQADVGGYTGAGERAEMSELKLVREKANARWKIDSAEIERTFKSRKKPK